MASSAKITSIKDIQERKVEIQEELALSKKAAARSLSIASGEAKTFILRDVILPAAGVAFAGYIAAKAIGYVLSDSDDGEVSAQAIKGEPQPPQALSPQRPPVTQPAPVKRSLLKSLLHAGSILIPAGKAIAEVIKDAKKG